MPLLTSWGVYNRTNKVYISQKVMDAPFLPRQSMENVMSPLETAHRGSRLSFCQQLGSQVLHRVTLVWIPTDPELRHLPGVEATSRVYQ